MTYKVSIIMYDSMITIFNHNLSMPWDPVLD